MGLADRKPTKNEMAQMKELLHKAMQDGALGISTGLFYVPGSFAETDEIIELSRVVASYGGIYISHIREETSNVIDSVNETIKIGEESGIPVQITHHKVMGVENWGLSIETLRLIDEARARGVDVTIDQYPYTASQTGLKALIPQWAQEGGDDRMIERIKSSETRNIIKNEVINKILFGRGGGHPKNIFISRNSWDPSMTGKNLAQLTEEAGLEPTAENAADIVFSILERGYVTAVYHAINPDDVDRIMQHPATAIGSDGPVGIFGEGTPHPRQYGAFARVLGYYVRDRQILTLEQAIRKMSSQRAKRLGIQNRGLIATGYFADIAIFDPNKIKGLIDKQSEELGQVKKKAKGITQSDDPTMLDVDKLTLSQIDAVKSQYFFLHSLSISFNESSNKYALFAPPPFYFEKKLEEMNYSISRIKNYLNQLKEN
mgnify:CR=1 FL=1